MKKSLIIFGLLVLFIFVLTGITYAAFEKPLFPGEENLYNAAKKEGGDVVSYDTGPYWANWINEFKAFQKRYPGMFIVYNDLGSGNTVARLEKEKNNPQADTAYYSVVYGPIAKSKGVTQGFKPYNFDKIPQALKDPEGHWFAIHQGTVAFVVNNRLVKNIPHTWRELAEGNYKNSVYYLDPRTTGLGHAVVLAAAYAAGGSEDNPSPGIELLAKIQKKGNIKGYGTIVAYSKFLKGEIPIWITYDFNGYKAKYIGKADATIVIPQDGTVTVPYVISMVKGAPHPNAAKLWLSFLLSDMGQAIFAQGFVRPTVKGISLPKDVLAKFAPMKDYEAAHNVNWTNAKKTLGGLKKEWEQKVLGK